ncbi:hypothetical protein AC1031_019162 [Aphanomyces cochlioides]|nr:hypothetical protein AC1031_019162 [Aphanomyces cochlioides]
MEKEMMHQDQGLMTSKPYALYREEEIKTIHPFATASWFSLATYNWISSLMVLGAKQPLMEHHVWQLPPKETCAGIFERFQPLWASAHANKFMPRFNVALIRCFWKDILVTLAALLLTILSQLSQPLLIQGILQYLQDQPLTLGISNGYVLIALFGLTAFLHAMFVNYGLFTASKFGVNMRSITMDMVYQKSLKLSASARQLTTSGEIVTLMSSDSERFCEAAHDSLWIIVSPFTFLCSMVLVWCFFGVGPALCGAGVNVCVLLVASWFASAIGETRLQVTAMTEERVKVTSEILQGIRVMKFYAWEPAITQRVETLRHKETMLLRRLNLLRVLNVEFLFLSPSSSVRPRCRPVNLSRQALYHFPRAFAGISESQGAGRRLDAFFDLEEQSAPVFSNNVPGTVRLVHATLAWQSTPPTCLSNLNLTIAPGSLVMVVGSVGAGKSSLISAVLGEMHLVQGSVDVDGSLALVSQEPWIRNDTVRGNILFEDPYDASWYKTVLQAVQLEADMRLLPAGDKTEIGEQGINLSGGQKARVNLARALYKRESNVLLLDDPLSAVDVHVAKAIFDQAIEGLARGKTRIMVMNSHYQFLQHADRIVVMENGSIVGDGTFAELYTAFPNFSTAQATKHEPILQQR